MKRNLLIFKQNPIELTKSAGVNNYFDKVGRKAGILGYENGNFEFWCYPIKICRNFSLSFLLDNSSLPIESSLIAESISTSPEKTVITYCYQSFTVKEIFITAFNEPGSIILLDVETVEPIKIIVSFIPELQPMWPAGLGGQICYWSKDTNSFILTESTKKFNAFIGSPDAKNMGNTPAHMLSEKPNQFCINVTPESCKENIFVIGLAGGRMDRESLKIIYENLINDPIRYYNECHQYYASLRENTLNIITPDEKINLAFEWGKVSFDNMLIDNPDLGLGLVAGLGCAGKSGRPGFGWFFGGDASLNSFAMLSYGEFKTIKTSLKFIQQFQRKDGKIAHEVSQSAKLVDWFEEYPYAYIHADTTCFYLISLYEYMIASGDTEFIKESWESILNAYNWCISTDENQDGLMDNTKAGLGAFEIPPFTKVKTDIYLSASFTMALFGLQEMAKAIGKKHDEFLAKFEIALKKLNEIFWGSENEYFAFAVDYDDKLIRETTALCSVPMIWKLLDEEKSQKALEKMNSAEIQTDWGTRSMSSKSSFYDPLNYNYGAVWPFMTGFTSLANYRYRNPVQAFSILRNTIEHVFDNALGNCHEVFSGNTNRHLEESVPHQAFSTLGYMLPLIKGTLGLSCNAIINEINFSPQLPPNWEYVQIQNFKSGLNSFDFFFEKGINLSEEIENKNEIIGIHFHIHGPERYKIKINLAFSPFTNIFKVLIGNTDAKYEIIKGTKDIILIVEISELKQGLLLIEYQPDFAIIPYENLSEIGAINQGLKVINEIDTENFKSLIVEGLSGQKYLLEVLHSNLISKLEGAELYENAIVIEFPDLGIKEFVRKEIKIFRQ